MLRVGALIAIIMVGSIAHAEPDRARAQAAMETYFSGEETGGYILVGMGAAGLATGGVLYLQGDSDLTKGMAYPLLGLGIAHLGAGIYIKIASRNRVEKFTGQIEADPTKFVAEERPRMKGVSTTFTVLKIVEAALVVGGLTTAYFAHRSDRKKLEGLGYGVALEAGATLVFDIFASSRAHTYRDDLAAVDVGAARDVGGKTTLLILHTGAF